MNSPTMAQRVEEYLAHRRALGYQLRIEGQMLCSFARFVDCSGYCGPLTTEIALRWARLPERADRLYQARRLEVVRTLAKYLAPREPATEVPARGLLGPAHARTTPFIYSEADIAGLVRAARELAPADGLRPMTYAVLIGLLACSGLRISEALALAPDDTDLTGGVLTIRQTKFRKSRLVPLHASVIGPLRDYSAVRDRCVGGVHLTTFFVSDAGRSLPYSTVSKIFRGLLRTAMPDAAARGRPRPRLHDLRHTFACRRLLAAYRDGSNIDRVTENLSAYLGHAKVTDTYWYLTGIPELLALAGQRFEKFATHTHGGVRCPLPSTS
jgi:integrase